MSALDIWQPILERAPAATSHALRTLEEHVHRLRVALENEDWTTLHELWEGAGRWRSGIEGEGST